MLREIPDVKLSNFGHKLYGSEDGSFYIRTCLKNFRVTNIVKTMEEANKICASCPETAVIDEDFGNGLIYLAEIRESKV